MARFRVQVGHRNLRAGETIAIDDTEVMAGLWDGSIRHQRIVPDDLDTVELVAAREEAREAELAPALPAPPADEPGDDEQPADGDPVEG